MSDLEGRQAALVRALLTGGPVPEGFDVERVRAAEEALLRKRAGEVAVHVPLVRAALGPRFVVLFAEWARGTERRGACVEAGGFVDHLVARGEWVTVAEPDRRPWRPRWWRAVARPRPR